MKSLNKEFYLFLATWLLVYFVSNLYWFNSDPEIPLAFNALNFVGVSTLFGMFFLGMFLLKGDNWKRSIHRSHKSKRIGLTIAFIAYLGLASVFYTLLIGLLFAWLVSALLEILKPKLTLLIAVAMPILAGLYDISVKDMPFYWDVKGLFILINVLVLQFSAKVKSEQRAKDEANVLLTELKATQHLLAADVRKDERIRISRDLHDSLGHKLTALNLQLELALHVNDDQIIQKIQQAKTVSLGLLDDVRRNVNEFRHLDDFELIAAVNILIAGLPRLDVDLTTSFDDHLLTGRQAEALFRCTQESITNTLRHSDATMCSIDFLQQNDTVLLTIQDNGSGRNAPLKLGNGLSGMQERFANLDGHVTFSLTHSGFETVASLPISRVH